jgi:hypothetical protein
MPLLKKKCSIMGSSQVEAKGEMNLGHHFEPCGRFAQESVGCILRRGY